MRAPDVDVAVIGSTGFIGSAVLERAGRRAMAVTAPRLETSARTLESLHADLRTRAALVADLANELAGAPVALLAAGLPASTGPASDALIGANALLPAVTYLAAKKAECCRVVHVSSAVVQGRGTLDSDIPRLSSASPYALSKILGELLLLELYDADGPELVIYRPPSVHGPNRRVTQALAQVARSRLSFVASPGTQRTPQALIENTSDAALFLCGYSGCPPQVVHHPWEGITTLELMTCLGAGRVPREIPPALARSISEGIRSCFNLIPRLKPHARRLEMLWLGQDQASSWLSEVGWHPPVGPSRWKEIGDGLAR